MEIQEERSEEIRPSRYEQLRRRTLSFTAGMQSLLSIEQGSMVSIGACIRTIMERHYQVTTQPVEKSWHDNRSLPKGRRDRFITLTFPNVIDKLTFVFDISSASREAATVNLRLRCYLPYYDEHGDRFEAKADISLGFLEHEDVCKTKILELIDKVLDKLLMPC